MAQFKIWRTSSSSLFSEAQALSDVLAAVEWVSTFLLCATHGNLVVRATIGEETLYRSLSMISMTDQEKAKINQVDEYRGREISV